nr:immunoglobulin light chain junction region [Macaca mulatta]
DYYCQSYDITLRTVF